MSQSKKTKRALLASMLSLLLCCVMLIGSTFAWFTDSVTSGRNQIVAGNLDVELEYKQPSIDAQGAVVYADWAPVGTDTSVFLPSTATLWEPGHVEVAYLKVRNAGSLALKYQLSMNAVDTVTSTSVLGNTIALSDYLEYAVIPLASETTYADRDAVKAALESAAAAKLNQAYSSEEAVLYPAENTPDGGSSEQYIALIVIMPDTVGNEANYDRANNAPAPEIDLGINLFATQTPYESDSFNDQYDLKAYPTKVSTAEALTAALVNGDTAALTEDITLTSALTLSTDAAVDLGGHNLTLSGTGITVSGGTLTVKDSEGTGVLSNEPYVITLTNDANVVVESGTLMNTAETSTTGAVIQNNGTGTVTINGGTLETQRHASYLIRNASTGSVVINGGTMTSTAAMGYGYGIINGGKGTITVNGGAITTSSSTFFNTKGGTLIITDGEFTSTDTAVINAWGATSGSIVISGGTFTSTASSPANKVLVGGNTDIATLTGGTFNGDPIA